MILSHHRPQDEKLQWELVPLLAAADTLANYVQHKHEVAEFTPGCPAFSLLYD
ncbi:hypothetical protein J8F10_06115 [Gemmata sp. G18]|uniref:Uncharacterized protein n=1 Tax=Gemmata palustris TaxID=2822762 RepID=A0ABS5BMC6_9BACT|nr:hypothetical protein [Gemmata palustris]MBP3954856.1 hypothetical protein [Gemmata palustris]